jgi:uncharacterized membrane protein YebE (DUF533 family)
MFDVNKLLGAFMQNNLSHSGERRMEHALGERGLGQSGGILNQLLSNRSSSAGTGGGLLGNLANAAQSAFGDTGREVKSGNPAALGGLGALAGALLGGGSRSAKGALGGGALALLGGLALDALQNRNRPATTHDAPLQSPPLSGKPSDSMAEVPLGLRPPANPAEEQELAATGTLILKAMINAAKADGHIDDAETQNIMGKLKDAGTESEGLNFVLNEMHQPLDLEGLVREVPNPQVAAEVYAASLLAIEVDTQAERDYLQRLADGLKLDSGVVQRLHTTLGVTE